MPCSDEGGQEVWYPLPRTGNVTPSDRTHNSVSNLGVYLLWTLGTGPIHACPPILQGKAEVRKWPLFLVFPKGSLASTSSLHLSTVWDLTPVTPGNAESYTKNDLLFELSPGKHRGFSRQETCVWAPEQNKISAGTSHQTPGHTCVNTFLHETAALSITLTSTAPRTYSLRCTVYAIDLSHFDIPLNFMNSFLLF